MENQGYSEGFYYLIGKKGQRVAGIVSRGLNILTGKEKYAFYLIEENIGRELKPNMQLYPMPDRDITLQYNSLQNRLQSLQSLSCADNEDISKAIHETRKVVETLDVYLKRFGKEPTLS